MRAVWFIGVLGLVLLPGFLPASAEPAPPPPPAVDLQHLPWASGEKLTYLVSLLGLEAAQGIFVAEKKGDQWEFKLSLASRGLVEESYPFTGTFWSMVGPETWRSTEYGEYRFEPKRTIKERTQIDYAQHQGTREDWIKGETKTFSIQEDALDDVGSMLYHLRAAEWKPGDKRTLFVYESNKEKQASVECLARETRAFGNWPKQPLLKLQALPTKGTKRRGSLTMWMTDDARHLPLHAEISFVYGSFSIDLTKAEKTLPAGH